MKRRVMTTIHWWGAGSMAAMIVAFGCSTDKGVVSPPSPVANNTPDAGAAPGDAGVDMVFAGPGTCDVPRVMIGTHSALTLEFDTTDGPDGQLDLGQSCGNEQVPFAPQEVIAYTVPGEGPQRISFTTATDNTLTNFDTVVQVRRSCYEIPTSTFPPSCFDDVSRTDPRSAGRVAATGGEVLYFIVAGFSRTPFMDGIDQGPIGFEVSARPNDVPVLTGGDVRTVAEQTDIVATGSDDDEDMLGVIVSFEGPGETPLDVNGDGMANDMLIMGFNQTPTGVDWRGVATAFAISVRGGAVYLSDRLAALRAVQARLTVFDDSYALSEEMRVPVRFLDEVGMGAACGDAARCTIGLVCQAGRCVAGPEMAALCQRATALTIDLPMSTTTHATHSGELPAGGGLVEASCAHTPGAEALVQIAVPAGAFDLIATTDLNGTANTNTVLYVRSACADRLSEPLMGCNDDVIAGSNARSRVELRDVAAGDYTIFVENVGHPSEDPLPYELDVALRPVLASNQACDPSEADNRCSSGACPAATSVCP